ncbi:MAG TPA: outer membrane lipoprotein carrier protein LolA [Gemmatimonadales bacterium]|nr:outer membrane lipoprotein carrier protein LolA [Gemmatimonadales bacterium]
MSTISKSCTALFIALLAAAACSDGAPRSESEGGTPVASGGAAYDSSVSPDTPVSSSDTDAGVAATGDSSAPGSGAAGGGTTGSTGGTEPASGGSPQPVDSAQATGAADRQDVDAVIARATTAYNSARTARGTFTQLIVNSQTGSRVTAEGEFMRQQPDRFAFNFTDPAGDRIVADGRHVWLYVPSTNPGQVLRSTLTKSNAGSYDLGSLFFENTRERFNVADGGSETVQGKATRVLRLTPRASAPFARATVWVDPASGNLVKFTVVDSMGLERTVTITSYAPNVPVPGSAFTFDPPPGVRVVDAESIGG